MHDFLIKYVQDIQTISVATQAISSVVLVVVTVVYVFFSYKLLHASHKAFLLPISIKMGDKHWIIKVKNLGPGLAKNLKIKVVGVNIVAFDPIKKGEVWVEKKFDLAKGPLYLMPNAEAEYSLGEHLFSFEGPFYITWESITGKGQKSSWTKDVGEPNFVPLGFSYSVKWRLNRFKIRLLSPYYGFIKWLRFRKAPKSKSDEHEAEKEKD
jgi:hypothetical protein